jgi:predicted acylesterase/phospholipase RssA
VSLAVWMGGACREVVRLHADGQEVAGPYGRLLSACGYGKEQLPAVSIDVLAGTSAGGLNAVLLAAHLIYELPFDNTIRNLWLQVGDLESLTWSPSEPCPPSLLRGDDGFYKELNWRLQHNVAKQPDQAHRRSPETLRLILAATRLRARRDALRPAVGHELTLPNARAHFRFRYRKTALQAGRSVLSDFGFESERAPTLERLAYAARTSSSFPGAFEPACIRVASINSEPVDTPIDFRGISSETGDPDDELGPNVELFDGGVTDNIPIDWALRAIAGSPADRPVDRWLLYLQPVPSKAEAAGDPSAQPSQRRVTRLLRMVLRTLGSKTEANSLLNHAHDLRAATDTAQQLDAIAGLGLLAHDVHEFVNLASSAQRLQTYTALASEQIGARLRKLLEEPLAVIGPDPLPLGPHPWPLRRLDDAGLASEYLAVLAERAPASVIAPPLELADVPGCTNSPLSIARAVTLLASWVRAAEYLGFHVDPELRASLYRARFVVEILVASHDRLILAAVDDDVRAALPHPTVVSTLDPTASVRRAGTALAALLARTNVPALPTSFAASSQTAWETWAEEFVVALNTAFSTRLEASGPTLEDFWPVIAQLGRWIGAELASAATRISDAPPETQNLLTGREDRPVADGAPIADPDAFTALAQAAAEPFTVEHDPMINVLAAAEVLLGPLRPDPLAESTPARFADASAANQSPLERLIFGRTFSSVDNLVANKLSGNQIHNFAAFLSARWRLSDWTWGRLDMARTLVEVALRHRTEPFTVDELRELYCGHASGKGQEWGWSKFLEDRWTRMLEVGNLEYRAVEIITERLHWDILAEEIPLLRALHEREGRDLPPGDDLFALAQTRAILVEQPSSMSTDDVERPSDQWTPQQVHDSAHLLGDVGAETVRELLRAADLRRAVLRIGLVAWRAVQPSGRPAAWGRRILGVLEPLVWLPLLLAITAPLATTCAGILSAGAVALASNRAVSLPSDLIILSGIALAIGVGLWERGNPPANPTESKAARRRRGRLAGVGIIAVLLCLSVLVTVAATTNAKITGSDCWRVIGIALCSMLAAIVPLWRVPRRPGTGPAGSSAAWRARAALLVGGTGVIAGVVAGGVGLAAVNFGQGGVARACLPLLVLYAPLAAETLMLHAFYPPAPSTNPPR